MTVGSELARQGGLTFLLALILFAILLLVKQRVRGTTLQAPAIWALLSAASLGLLALLAWFSVIPTTGLAWSTLHYAVACSTLCPVVAVLGAKRPQNVGWQWIVLSLWAILIWPAFQSLALRGGPRLELFAAWRIFLVVLIGLGLLNYLPTRHWLAALCVAAGQGILLGEPLGIGSQFALRPPLALGCLVLAALWAIWQPAARSDESDTRHLSERWLQFRNGWGAFWGLRILQRVNETAQLRGWPVQLEWSGFTPHQPRPLEASEIDEIEQTLDTLLRRFL